MGKVGSSNSVTVSFTEPANTPATGKAEQARAQRSIKKMQAFSEGKAISRSHVQSGSAADRLMSIRGPQRRSAPKPLPKTDAVRQQAFLQKIAAEKPPTLGFAEFDTQLTSFVRLPTTKINTLLTQMKQSGGAEVSIQHLRSFRHCMQQSGTSASPEIRQQAKEFALAFLAMPADQHGARTGFSFDAVLTTYALDIAQGKF